MASKRLNTRFKAITEAAIQELEITLQLNAEDVASNTAIFERFMLVAQGELKKGSSKMGPLSENTQTAIFKLFSAGIVKAMTVGTTVMLEEEAYKEVLQNAAMDIYQEAVRQVSESQSKKVQPNKKQIANVQQAAISKVLENIHDIQGEQESSKTQSSEGKPS